MGFAAGPKICGIYSAGPSPPTLSAKGWPRPGAPISTLNVSLDNITDSIESPGRGMTILNGQAPLGETCEEPLIARWLEGNATHVGQHSVMILSECPGSRACLAVELHETFRDHYMSQEMFSKRVADLGAPETSEILRELLPTKKQSRSGDAGEILATEIAEKKLQYEVPIRRLRWKDGREAALRGDDIVGVARDCEGKIRFLKGESKSRAALTPSTIKEAGQALDEDMGRPSRHAVLFIASRLRELGRDALATELEKALLQSFSGHDIEHLLFVISGNNPGNILAKHVAEIENQQPKRHAIGVRIPDHGQFIAQLFDGI